jgi:hypothetical protein
MLDFRLVVFTKEQEDSPSRCGGATLVDVASGLRHDVGFLSAAVVLGNYEYQHCRSRKEHHRDIAKKQYTA